MRPSLEWNAVPAGGPAGPGGTHPSRVRSGAVQYAHPLIRLQVRMDDAARPGTAPERMMRERDQRTSEAVRREQSRLLSFIRQRVPDPIDAEDILQDVFVELAEANRLLMPIEHLTAWLFRVARNRIVDLLRRKKPERSHEWLGFEEVLPSREAGPEALHARRALLEELAEAVDELPEEQRAVFIAHELDGKSFKEMAAESGVGINTLLSRKRYAVLHLRERLKDLHDELERG